MFQIFEEANEGHFHECASVPLLEDCMEYIENQDYLMIALGIHFKVKDEDGKVVYYTRDEEKNKTE